MADTDRSAGASRDPLTELRKLVQQVADGAGELTTATSPFPVASAPQLATAGSAPVESRLTTRLLPTTNQVRDGYGIAPKPAPVGDGDHYAFQVVHGQTARAGSSDSQVPARSYAETDAEVDHNAATARVVALVELAQGGDAEAFGQLYDMYLSTIYRYIYYRVGAHALAEDLTSDTFLRALRSLSSFRWQGRDFGAWLITIARNLITDHFKSGRFRLEVATGEILDYDSASDGLEDDVLAHLTNQVLIDAVKGLRADQQECLVLRFLSGLSVAETASVLGKSAGAVKQLQLRAIRNLAKSLPDGLR